MGVVANATFIASNSVQKKLNGPIVGLSPTNANLTLYYEDDDWGLRGSANHRSGYMDARYDGKNVTSQDGYKATTYVDAAAFYKLSDGLRLRRARGRRGGGGLLTVAHCSAGAPAVARAPASPGSFRAVAPHSDSRPRDSRAVARR